MFERICSLSSLGFDIPRQIGDSGGMLTLLVDCSPETEVKLRAGAQLDVAQGTTHSD